MSYTMGHGAQDHLRTQEITYYHEYVLVGR